MKFIQIISIIITVLMAVNKLSFELNQRNIELESKTRTQLNKLAYRLGMISPKIKIQSETMIKVLNLTENELRDSWNTRIRIDLNSNLLISAGKDRKFNTDDDIKVSIKSLLR